MNNNNLKKLAAHDKKNIEQTKITQQQFNNYKERMTERPTFDTNEKKDIPPIIAYILIVAIIIVLVGVAVFIVMGRR